jgi:hypothetical protein
VGDDERHVGSEEGIIGLLQCRADVRAGDPADVKPPATQEILPLLLVV